MSFQRDGITNVRAVALPDGMSANGRPAALSRAALVTWRSNLDGWLYQVYVNGRLAGTALQPQQRHLVVQAPASFEAAVQVEVIAVQPAEACVDFTDRLDDSPIESGRVKLILLRSQSLPAGAQINIYYDAGTGEIDYHQPLNASPISVWVCGQDKAGFGMAQFGASDFGYDAAASIGLGRGCFGLGEFGLDADVMEWVSPMLPAGTYRFSVVVTDEHGHASAVSETGPIPVVTPARPAASLRIAAFDPQAGRLVLSISDHM